MIRSPRQDQVPTRPSNWRKLHRADLLFGCLLAICCLVNAWFTVRGSNGDTISYYDLSEAVRQHAWRATMNASWFPLYPALLTLTRALFHFNPRFDGAAERLLNGVVGVGFVASSAIVAVSLRNLVDRGKSRADRLPTSALCAATATIGYFLWSVDVAGTKPDALLAMLVLLSLASLAQGIATLRWGPFLLAGALAGAAYWTKAFAFPLTCLVLLFTAIATLRSRCALLRLLAMTAVFGVVIAPYIAAISAAKHRFTIGDAGRLNSAWFVNGAERFNPVNDPGVHGFGQAAGTFRHPPVLLSRTPEVVLFNDPHVFGHMPAWDDFSFWSDGLSSRPIVRQYLQSAAFNTRGLLSLAAMRLQVLLLVLAPLALGFAPRRLRGEPARVLLALAAASAASIGLYILVHLEARYILFAVVLLAASFYVLLAKKNSASSTAVAHAAILLLCTLVCIADLEEVLHGSKAALAQTGDHPTHALFNGFDYRAGLDLRDRIPPGSQIACLGLGACYGDAMWSWYAGDRITGVITLPHSMESASPDQICTELAHHPEAQTALKSHGIHGIVAWFPGPPACDPGWQPLPGSNGYYFLPTT